VLTDRVASVNGAAGDVTEIRVMRSAAELEANQADGHAERNCSTSAEMGVLRGRP
jgi:hypothetical protein